MEMAGNLFVVDALEIKWGKSLMQMPFLTIKGIEAHRQNSGKDHGRPILKTLERGRKCMEERYISADSVYTAVQDDHFLVKGSLRTIRLNLNINTGYVNNAMCSCPAGLSGYCNHVMALLLELADYSLNQLQNVPEELQEEVALTPNCAELCLWNLAKLKHDGQKQMERYFLNVLPRSSSGVAECLGPLAFHVFGGPLEVAKRQTCTARSAVVKLLGSGGSVSPLQGSVAQPLENIRISHFPLQNIEQNKREAASYYAMHKFRVEVFMLMKKIIYV